MNTITVRNGATVLLISSMAWVFGLSFTHAESLDAGVQIRVGNIASSSVRGQVKMEREEEREDRREERGDARMEDARDRAEREIDRRDNALDALVGRVQDMVRLPESERVRIAAMIEAQIASLEALKARIGAASDLDSLKTDIKSIRESYRTFQLTIPQTRITVAADKIKATASSMTAFATKLERKIDEAKTAGNDVTSLLETLGDMKAHISDAIVQADAAITAVASLSADNGDTAKAEANMRALKDAHAKIKAGMEDLKEARKDASSILKGLRALGVRTDIRADVSTSVQ